MNIIRLRVKLLLSNKKLLVLYAFFGIVIIIHFFIIQKAFINIKLLNKEYTFKYFKNINIQQK